MPLPIEESQEGLRIKLQGRFSDHSGHSLIMAMLQDLRNWNQQQLLTTALSLMTDAWQSEKEAGGQLTPLQPNQALVTKEMRDLYKESHTMLLETRQLLKQLLTGKLSIQSGQNGEALQEVIDRIDQIEVIATAGASFGGELRSNEEEIIDDW